MIRNGDRFFAYPIRDIRHEKVAKVLRGMTEDVPVGTWWIIKQLLPEEQIKSKTIKQCRHLCEKLLNSMENNGFIRRLQCRMNSSTEVTRNSSELQWIITIDGRLFEQRYYRYIKSFEDIESRDNNRSSK